MVAGREKKKSKVGRTGGNRRGDERQEKRLREERRRGHFEGE